MPREVVTLNLERKSTSQSWGFRVVGGTDVELILQVDLVHGIGCPAGRAGLKKDDSILFVNEKDVTSLKHTEFVQLIKSLSVTKLTMVVERGDHVIPSISEAFPNPDMNIVKEMTQEEKMAYYEMAMKKGISHITRLIPDMFTSVGKMKIKTPKYNSPLAAYSDQCLEDMIGGSTVDPDKLDPDGPAFKKFKNSKRFDPSKSEVMRVLNDQKEGNFSVDKGAVRDVWKYEQQNGEDRFISQGT